MIHRSQVKLKKVALHIELINEAIYPSERILDIYIGYIDLVIINANSEGPIPILQTQYRELHGEILALMKHLSSKSLI